MFSKSVQIGEKHVEHPFFFFNKSTKRKDFVSCSGFFEINVLRHF